MLGEGDKGRDEGRRVVPDLRASGGAPGGYVTLVVCSAWGDSALEVF